MTTTDIAKYYSEPDKDRPCSRCVHRRYDSFHDEMWCGHSEPPEGTGARAIIGPWGTCEGWTEDTDA